MKPPFEITSEILHLVATISERIGTIQTSQLDRLSPKLRKGNRIKTIHHSLAIEGNELSESQVTAILEGKQVLGRQKDITEVENAMEVYHVFNDLSFDEENDFLSAHRLLMKGLIQKPGFYRQSGVAITKDGDVQHYAPGYDRVPFLMKDLFSYLQTSHDHVLIKGAVFHYELEFIHPFLDGNGRMGRLWNQLILSNQYPVFQYVSLETLIRDRQATYYSALAASDKLGASTPFITFMLNIILDALSELTLLKRSQQTALERIDYFLEHHSSSTFTRADYLACFPTISSPTASRDLKQGIEHGRLKKIGNHNQTKYDRK
jgi:Fic family protein